MAYAAVMATGTALLIAAFNGDAGDTEPTANQAVTQQEAQRILQPNEAVVLASRNIERLAWPLRTQTN